MLAGERAGGERKIIMCRGTPAQFFFQCVNLVIFKLVIFLPDLGPNCLKSRLRWYMFTSIVPDMGED